MRPQHNPFVPDQGPVAVPARYRGGGPLTDYVALLQRAHELDRELADAREGQANAANEAWAAAAEALRKVEQALRAALDAPDRDEAARQGARALGHIAALWSEQDIEFRDATGKRVADVSPEEFETLSTRDAERPEEDGRVVETWRPALWRRGALLRPGQIIVARWAPAADGPASHEGAPA